KIDDVIERPVEIASDLTVGQIPPAVLFHQLKDSLPRLGIRDHHHPAKDPSIGGRTEDCWTEYAVEQAIRTRMIEGDQVAGSPAVPLSEMRLEPALPVAVA